MNLKKIIKEEVDRIFTDIHGKKTSNIDYTGVILEGSQEAKFEHEIGNRLEELGIEIPIDWKMPDNYHMTIALGELGLRLKMTGIIGENVELEVYAVGVSNKAIAVAVNGMYSKNDIQHITVAFKGKPEESNNILDWTKFEPFKVTGVIREVERKNLEYGKLHESHGGYAGKPLPKIFNHLKWKLNTNQKYYLDDLCSVNPDSLNESDIKNASKFLGIPEKNVKSIINTYSTYSTVSETHGDSKAAIASRLTFGNKAANAFDIGIENNANNGPIKSSSQINNNPPTMSKSRIQYEAEKQRLDRKLYKTEKEGEHPVKSRERFYENLNTSLMMYLFCESNPKDINLREDGKIQIDFEPIIFESNFNNLSGGPSYETEKYKRIKNLLEDFNNKFGCSYVVCEHINLESYQRIFIEHNITKQIDMSEDSMVMMKKFLLPKIIVGYKIEKSNQQIAELLGVDAGDTSWLYGSIGESPKSDLYTKK